MLSLAARHPEGHDRKCVWETDEQLLLLAVMSDSLSLISVCLCGTWNKSSWSPADDPELGFRCVCVCF